MADYKIIFTGPVGAGKSTAIATLSDAAPINTDKLASDMTQNRKSSTTVALDYGTLILAGGEKLHLYGTPGQERFDFMWEILANGAIGLILLLDNTSADPLQDMRFFLNAFKRFIAETQVVIGVTQMDLSPRPLIEDYQRELRGWGRVVPVFEVDARARADLTILLQALLFSLDPGLREIEDD